MKTNYRFSNKTVIAILVLCIASVWMATGILLYYGLKEPEQQEMPNKTKWETNAVYADVEYTPRVVKVKAVAATKDVVGESESEMSAEVVSSDTSNGNPDSAVYQTWESLDDTTKQYFSNAAEEFGIDENIIAAIAYNETRYTASATHVNANGTTDWGMVQCNDVTFDIINSYIGILSMSELLDAETGIRGGCALLCYYKDTYGLTGTDLLLAYQEGYGNYKKVMRGEAQPWQAYYNVCQYMSDLPL